MSLLPPDDALSVAGRDATTGLEDDLAGLVAPLDQIERRPVEEHPAAYEQVHRGLRDVLAGRPGEDVAPQG